MLSSLSRGFEATLVAEQLVRTTGARAIGDLLREGILRDAGVSSTALRCVCDLQRPRCTPPVDERDGAYVALCPEFGRPVSVEVDLLQRYRFDWPTWAARIRNANSLSTMIGGYSAWRNVAGLALSALTNSRAQYGSARLSMR